MYQVSNWLQNTALNFYVYSKTGSTLSVGVVQFLQYSPLLFLPFFGGILIDKFDKYKLLLFTQFTLMILAFLLYLIAKNNTNLLINLLFVIVPMGILKTFDIPLRQTFIAYLVSTDKLRSAISMYSTIVNLSRFIGPFLFGIIVHIFSLEASFLASALLLIPNMFFLSLLKIYIQNIQNNNKTSNFDTVFDAVNLVLKNKNMKSILISVLVIGIFGWFFYILLPEYTCKILNLSPSAYGYLTALSGIGSILGSLLPLVLKDVYTLMKFGIFAYALGISLWFASIYFYLILGLGIFLNGFGLSLFYACANVQIQAASPRHIKGRVLALYTSVFIGSQPLSFMVGVLLHKYLGIWITLLSVILVCAILFAFVKEESPKGTLP